MIESQKSYENFIKEISKHGIILHIIPVDDKTHPTVSVPSIVFIRDAITRKTYYISFKHEDAPVIISKDKFINDLNNLKNMKWVVDKKSFIQMLPLTDLYDMNLLIHLYNGETIDFEKYETNSHKFIKRINRNHKILNNIIPLLKHQEMFDSICDEFVSSIGKCKLDDGYKKENSIIIETLAELESNGIHIQTEDFKSFFDAQVYKNDLIYSQYNIYTSTGRPSNHFDNVNYAALNKDNGVRKCFVSRYGKAGKMVLMDYSAFHPRIICNLVKFSIPIDVDIYYYLGELYFNRKITEYDLDEAKKLTFRQLYGGVEEKYEHIKYFAELKSFINKNWKDFVNNGYVLTPLFKRIISDKHILDPNPNKLFNYILQATETEVSISSLKELNRYLKDKKTKAVLYTYDSILFDFHKEDGYKVLNDMMGIMKMGNRFPIKVYIGDSYDSVIQINT